MRPARNGADPVWQQLGGTSAGHCQCSALNDRRVGVRNQKVVTASYLSTPPALELRQQSCWSIVRWV